MATDTSSYTSLKKFTFVDDKNEKESLTVEIPEVAEASYGLYVWPSAPVLAQYVWENRNNFCGKNILELGAGTALPGIVAAKCGAKVTLSDCARFSSCLEHCKLSASLNGLPDIPVIGLTWGLIAPDLLDTGFDFVLASDCFYDTKDFEDIVMTMSFLLHQNPEAVVLFTYQVRSIDRNIAYLLQKWNLTGRQIPVDSTNIPHCSSPDHSSHEIQLYSLTLKKEKT